MAFQFFSGDLDGLATGEKSGGMSLVLRPEPPFTGVSGRSSGPKIAKKSQKGSFGVLKSPKSLKIGLFGCEFGPGGSGKSKWGLSNGGTLCNLRTIVYNCALLWPFFRPFLRGNFRRKMTTIVGNRGQLWTSTLSPHVLSAHLDFPVRLL